MPDLSRPRGRRVLAVLGAAALIGISSCGSPVNSKPHQAAQLLPPPAVDTADGLRIDGELIADRELHAEAQQRSLVLYSGTGKEAEDLTVARFQEETGINVELTRLPNNKLAERALSESGAGKLTADAIRVTDPRTARRFADAGVYAPYRTPFHDQLEQQGSLTSDRFFTGYYLANALAYNSALITEDRPTSWKDLADPRYAEQVGMVAITTGGTLNALTRFQIEQYGEEFLADQARLEPRVFNSTATEVDALARGEVSVAPVSFNNAFGAELAGAPIKMVIPEDGVSASQGPLGLTEKGARNPAAQVFANWTLSRSGQKFAAAQGFVPSRTDVPPVRAGDYQLPRADSTRLHMLREEEFARYARQDEELWKDTFDYIG